MRRYPGSQGSPEEITKGTRCCLPRAQVQPLDLLRMAPHVATSNSWELANAEPRGLSNFAQDVTHKPCIRGKDLNI